MNILAINTVDKTYSIALLSSNNILFNLIDNNNNVYNMINKILYHANITLNKLDLFVFNKGPGSFNGIRLSSAIANVINITLGTKILGISHLDILLYKTWYKLSTNKIILISFNTPNHFYIGKYFLYKEKHVLVYTKKQECYLQNINEVISLLKTLQGKWDLYINKKFYLYFFYIIVENNINQSFVKLLPTNIIAKDLILWITLIYTFKLNYVLNPLKYLTPHKLNYLNNNIVHISSNTI